MKFLPYQLIDFVELMNIIFCNLIITFVIKIWALRLIFKHTTHS